MIPPRPPRDQRLDVVRGWLQLTIFVSHIPGSFIGGWLIYGSWGLSDSSEQFVFLSGFVLGSVFARKSLRDGWGAAAGDLMGRVGRLWRIHLATTVLFGAMIWGVGEALFPGEVGRQGWAAVGVAPWLAGLAAVGLHQPAFMGILPIFVWCMLLLAPFMAGVRRWGAVVLLVPAGAWVAAQAGVALPGVGSGIAFNPFAWAGLYLGGAWLGSRALHAGRALPFDAPWAGVVSWAAGAVLLVGLVLRLGWYGFIPFSPVAEVAAMVGKEDLALPRLLHALALAWLVARHVPRDAVWMFTWPARALAGIGRVSLEVFCVGLFLSWMGGAVLRVWPWWGADVAVVGVGAVVLGVLGWWLGRRRAG